jgi:putative flippase GtrA
MSERKWQETGSRWLKFNAVGALGVAVQLGMLALLTRLAGWNYLAATAIAVEAALVHNFVWHERYTWADQTRSAQTAGAIARRMLGFHAGNGAVSLIGNLALMAWLAGALHLPTLLANGVSIVVCSVVNFVLGDRLIFRAGPAPASGEEQAALAGLATAFCVEAPGGAADLRARRTLVGHADEVALREGQEKQRRRGGKGQAETDGRPDEQRGERPKQVERRERGEDALELLTRAAKIEAGARQPI